VTVVPSIYLVSGGYDLMVMVTGETMRQVSAGKRCPVGAARGLRGAL